MAIKHSVVSVGTTATALHAGNGRLTGHKFTIMVQVPTGGATIYLGGSGVTTTNYGYALVAGGDYALDMNPSETLYAVVATGTQSAYIIKQGVI